MATRTRRTHSAVFKAQVALTAMGGEKTLAELAQWFDVHPTRITEWKRPGRGAWRDTVFVERLWKSVKHERVYVYAYDSVTEARQWSRQYMD